MSLKRVRYQHSRKEDGIVLWTARFDQASLYLSVNATWDPFHSSYSQHSPAVEANKLRTACVGFYLFIWWQDGGIALRRKYELNLSSKCI